MEKFGLWVLLILLGFVGVAINVLCVNCIFSWVLTPTYGLAVPSFWQLFLFFYVWAAIKPNYKEGDIKVSVKNTFIVILAKLFILGIAVLISLAVL